MELWQLAHPNYQPALKQLEETHAWVDHIPISAIQAACRGDLYVHPSMTRVLFKDLTTLPVSKPMPTEVLTPREIDVLRLLAKGYTNRQIADVLCLSMRTVEGHRASLMSRAERTQPRRADQLCRRTRLVGVAYARFIERWSRIQDIISELHCEYSMVNR